MPRSKQLSFHDYRMKRGRGGPRRAAGRPRTLPRRVVHHVKRPGVPNGTPAHITLRVLPGIPSLRQRRFVNEFRRTLGNVSERGEFRVVHYSVQRNHVHMIVEASGKQALGRGMKAVASRFAFAVNRVFQRAGKVLEGRYHLHLLTSPREVRNALAYVLLNARKHWKQRTGRNPIARVDAASSGAWFDGWKKSARVDIARTRDGRSPPGNAEVARPRSWLLKRGWRRHGLIGLAEVPGS